MQDHVDREEYLSRWHYDRPYLQKRGVSEDNYQYAIWFETERLTLLSIKIDNKVTETENRSRGLTNLITVYQNVIEEEMDFSFDQTTQQLIIIEETDNAHMLYIANLSLLGIKGGYRRHISPRYRCPVSSWPWIKRSNMPATL